MARKRKRGSKDESSERSAAPVKDYTELARWITHGLVVLAIGLVAAAPLIPEGGADQFFHWIPLILWLLLAAGVCCRPLLDEKIGFQVSSFDFFVYGSLI